MARRRRTEPPVRRIDDLTAALDELEVRFLLDPDTILDADPPPGTQGETAQPDPHNDR